MNLKNNIRMLSFILLAFCASLLSPIAVAAWYAEWNCLVAFAVTILIALALLFIFRLLSSEPADKSIRVKDGFFVVTATWALFAVLGALPFLLSGVLDDFLSALFETVSGFTTTGSTVFQRTEKLPFSILFYRSLTNFLGGMGVVVLFVAFMPKLGNAGVKFTAQEMAGTNKDKLLPKSSDSAKSLWLLYVGLTLVLIIILIFGGMTLFQAVCIAFSTMSTAGFTLHADSIAHFDNPSIDVILTLFMFVAAVNFSLVRLAVKGKVGQLVRDGEFRAYFFITATSSLLIAISLAVAKTYPSFFESLRYGAFQYVSFITTTGFVTADFSTWPVFAKMILFSAYFLGGCQGSTGGGVKIIRICVVFAALRNAIRQKLHPKGVFSASFDRQEINSRLFEEVIGFLFLYYLIAVASATLLSLDSQIGSMESAFSSSFLSIGNVGAGFSLPDFGKASALSKIVMSVEMLVGRLEIFTVAALFTRSFWRR